MQFILHVVVYRAGNINFLKGRLDNKNKTRAEQSATKLFQVNIRFCSNRYIFKYKIRAGVEALHHW